MRCAHAQALAQDIAELIAYHRVEDLDLTQGAGIEWIYLRRDRFLTKLAAAAITPSVDIAGSGTVVTAANVAMGALTIGGPCS